MSKKNPRPVPRKRRRRRLQRTAVAQLPTDPTLLQLTKMRAAAAIVGQVLAHFGAGANMKAQMFASPDVMTRFTNLLLTSTMANFDILHWDTDAATRDTVCQTAYKHGKLAKKMVKKKGRLTWAVIYASLLLVKEDCPGGAGGGLVCVE